VKLVDAGDRLVDRARVLELLRGLQAVAVEDVLDGPERFTSLTVSI
jgi:hypothetical protein